MVYIVNHGLGDRLLVSATDSKLDVQDTATASETTPTHVMWEECTETERQTGFRVCLQHPMVCVRPDVVQCQQMYHPQPVKEVVWHGKGDYMATLLADGEHHSWDVCICTCVVSSQRPPPLY